MDDDVAERDIAEELEAREDHPVLPESDDLARRRLQIARVEVAEVVGVVRPAEGRERPERRREPGVENVRFSGQLRRAALAARGRLRLLHGHMAVGTRPDRELMTPPELPRDAPVGSVVE
jgi:hypothetical protein